MRTKAKIFSAAICLLTVLLCAVTGFYYINLPDNYYLSEKGTIIINTKLFINGEVLTQGENTDDDNALVVSRISEASSTQNSEAQLKLFGIIPIKEVNVEQIDRPALIPCGTPFGIKILTDGAIVTGFGEIDGKNENKINPAKAGGIKCGDIIMEVNGMSIEKNSDIAAAVQTNPEETTVLVKRSEKILTLVLEPVKSPNDNLYKIGVWVRDSSAGIGTLTYYEPEAGVFGGLGHSVCDADTGRILPLFKGEAVAVAINSVVKGIAGDPGELCGTFLSRTPIGIIEHNTEAGIFGTMSYAPTVDATIPMAFKQEVKIGPAKILSTLSGSEPKEYDIIIEKIDYNENSQVKNMIIKITDRELISVAGGIVQGMSGSPIIQNGMLAGAVTHVFVNDATRGYAIFAENMYRKSNIVKQEKLLNEAA